MNKKRIIAHISIYTQTVIPVSTKNSYGLLQFSSTLNIVYTSKADSHFDCTITMKPGFQKSTKMQMTVFINKPKNNTKGLLVYLNKFK